MSYNYQSGKGRVNHILDSGLSIKEVGTVKSVSDLTPNDSYKTCITGIFIDIRDSAKLFSNKDQGIMSKMVKSFTSEVITILNDTNLNCLERGIRGDCVYAVYSTPNQTHINEVMNISYWINTLIKMLNKLFSQKGFPQIQIGIGISTAGELIIRAGRYSEDKDENIDNNAIVWVGKAVSLASKFSSFGHKDNIDTIVISDITYSNLTPENQQRFTYKNFTDKKQDNYSIYHGSVLMSDFNNWINNGMK